jgi:hypothetical protein
MLNYQDRDTEQSLVLAYHSMGISNYTQIIDDEHQSFPFCLVCSYVGVHFLLDVRGAVALLCKFDFDRETHCLERKVWPRGPWPNRRHFLVPDEINTKGVQDVLDRVLDLCFISRRAFPE